MACERCRSKALVRDDTTGNLVCADCGALQSFDNYDAQLGGLRGPQGTNVRVGSAGTGSALHYRDKKVYEAERLIEDIVFKLNLTSKFSDIKTMVRDVTDGEFGQGDWFPVLVGACSYVVMRIDNRNGLPMEEICAVIGCDLYELGAMTKRVVDHLGLQLPEFDLVGSFERTVKNSMKLGKVEREKKDRITKQGVFLMNCSVKWFLSTGRRPLPLVIAVLAFVSRINGISLTIEELAKELQVPISTCRSRYKELLENLVKVARELGLPWVKDVNVKNIVNHGAVLIGCMEAKSMKRKKEKYNNAIGNEAACVGLNLDDVLRECLNNDVGFRYDEDKCLENESKYYKAVVETRTRDAKDSENLNISHECLSLMYKKFCEEVDARRTQNHSAGRRKRGFELIGCRDWWSGKSELSKKLLLKQVLEKDVGFDALPPSFIKGREAVERRRRKIKAAKLRIRNIMHPSDVDDAVEYVPMGKKSRQEQPSTIDWEDLLIETLLLHLVKEEEIEKGYYDTLLDLYVFGSGSV